MHKATLFLRDAFEMRSRFFFYKQLKFRKRIILLEILKKENVYEWNTAQNEPIMILMLGLLESMLSKPNINIIILFQKKSIHTLENKVLMHQCAIAQRIST